MISYLQIGLCAILWGLSGPLIKWAALPVLSVVVIRFSLPIFLAYGWLVGVEKKKLSAINYSQLTGSFLTATGNGLFIVAIFNTSISNALLMLYTRPVITTVISAMVLKEVVSLRLWILLGVSLSGALVILTEHQLSVSSADTFGMLSALGSSIVIALNWAVVKKFGYGERTTSEIVFYQHLIGAVFALPFLPKVLMHSPINGLLLIVIYAAFVGFCGLMIYFHALRHIKLSHAMPITYIELVVALLCGVLFFGETLTFRTILGGVLIVGSAAMTILASRTSNFS